MGDNIYLPDIEKDFANRLNRIAGIAQQKAMIEELDRATYYIERNANAKIQFHALTIKLYHIIQDKIVFLTNWPRGGRVKKKVMKHEAMILLPAWLILLNFCCVTHFSI